MRTHDVQLAGAEIRMLLEKAQREHELTDIEMLQAVTQWQARVLKYMLRADPDRKADRP